MIATDVDPLQAYSTPPRAVALLPRKVEFEIVSCVDAAQTPKTPPEEATLDTNDESSDFKISDPVDTLPTPPSEALLPTKLDVLNEIEVVANGPEDIAKIPPDEL